MSSCVNWTSKDVSWGEARRTLREMDVQVPAIMLSDVADAKRMMTALRLGASDFFLRPVEDTAALFRSIERCVRQRQMRRELLESRQRLEAANTELRGTVKMLEQDQQAGRQVQLRMLPATPLVLDDYVFSHTVIPSLYLSGDFTDYFTVGETVRDLFHGGCVGPRQLLGVCHGTVEKPVCPQALGSVATGRRYRAEPGSHAEKCEPGAAGSGRR